MKRFKLTLSALILATAFALTGCRDVGREPLGINSVSDPVVTLREASAEEKSLPAETDDPEQPTFSETEASLTSEPEISSAPKSEASETTPTSEPMPVVSEKVPEPKNEVSPSPQPALPQGNCPDCGGYGHHNNALCGTCHGTGFYEEPTTPQGNCPYCNGTGHHNNAVCGTCHGTGFYEEPTTPQITSSGCHSQNRYQNSGHHNKHHCH